MTAQDTRTLDQDDSASTAASEPAAGRPAQADPDPEAADTGRARTGRKRSRGARRRGRWVIAAAAGGGLLWWVGWHSPVTLVEQVEVTTPRGISADAVRAASGITAADHVPGVDAEQVRSAVMAALPAVADVRLQRSLPDTIRLDVVAREPLAAVQSGETFYVIDAEGVVFDKASSATKLPVFRGSSVKSRGTAREVFLAIPDDLRAKVVRVTAGSRDDVTLQLRNGAVVRWGGVEDSDLKARVLAGLMTVKATRYDVSAPLLPTTMGSPEQATSTL